MALRGVVFDCFGVLAHGYLDYLRSLVAPAHLDELNDLSYASDRGMIRRQDYMEKVGVLLSKPASEVARLARAQIVRSDEMTRLIRSLRPTYKVAMLSNIGPGVMNDLFPREERAELFDAVVLSSEIGVTKPDRRAYEYAARELGLAPEECVMVDDLEKNVEGARLAGMRGILCSAPATCAADLRRLFDEEGYA
jgi:epoxide hydrolase-like predicted phosphatase